MDSALQSKALIKFRVLPSTACLFHHKSPGATGGATDMPAGHAPKKDRASFLQ